MFLSHSAKRKGTKKDGTKEKVVVDLVNGKIK